MFAVLQEHWVYISTAFLSLLFIYVEKGKTRDWIDLPV